MNLEGSTETVEQSKADHAASEEPVKPSVESVEQSSPQTVEACDQDKGPEGAADDNEAAQEPQIGGVQEHRADEVERLIPLGDQQQEAPPGVYPFLPTCAYKPCWGLFFI